MILKISFFFAEEIRKSAGNAGIKTFTSKLDQGLMTDAIARGEVSKNTVLLGKNPLPVFVASTGFPFTNSDISSNVTHCY